jgi:hypothetical protein
LWPHRANVPRGTSLCEQVCWQPPETPAPLGETHRSWVTCWRLHPFVHSFFRGRFARGTPTNTQWNACCPCCSHPLRRREGNAKRFSSPQPCEQVRTIPNRAISLGQPNGQFSWAFVSQKCLAVSKARGGAAEPSGRPDRAGTSRSTLDPWKWRSWWIATSGRDAFHVVLQPRIPAADEKPVSSIRDHPVPSVVPSLRKTSFAHNFRLRELCPGCRCPVSFFPHVPARPGRAHEFLILVLARPGG